MNPNLLQIIRPPGQGLLTVSSGKGHAEKFLSKYFKAAETANWERTLLTRLEKWDANSPFFLIGAPSDSGAGICRGAAHGPLAIRAELYQRQKKWASYDLGDIPCIPQLLADDMLSEKQLEKSGHSLWGDDFKMGMPVSPLNLLEGILIGLFKKNLEGIPLVLGGDHSLSGAVFKALHKAGKTERLAVLHFDAHTDLLEERFGVKECFGTWTSHALKTLESPKAWVQVGIRVSAKPKSHWESKFGLKQYWANECKKHNPETFALKLVEHWNNLGCTRLYITNDIDGTDPQFASATGTPEAGGLDPKWVKTVIRTCRENLPLIGADLMEVAPVLGAPALAKKTVKLAAEYIEGLFK